MKLLMACALSGNAKLAERHVAPLVEAILGSETISAHDKNYLFLVVEVSCQKLGIVVPPEAEAAKRTDYPRIANRLLRDYPIDLLVPVRGSS